MKLFINVNQNQMNVRFIIQLRSKAFLHLRCYILHIRLHKTSLYLTYFIMLLCEFFNYVNLKIAFYVRAKLLRKCYLFRGKNCLKMRKSKTGEAHFRFSAPFYTHLCYISICRVISGIETAWKREFLAADLCIFNSKISFF